MVLGKLPVPGCPTNLDDSRARAYCRHMDSCKFEIVFMVSQMYG